MRYTVESVVTLTGSVGPRTKTSSSRGDSDVLACVKLKWNCKGSETKADYIIQSYTEGRKS